MFSNSLRIKPPPSELFDSSVSTWYRIHHLATRGQFPLVTTNHSNHLPHMLRTKTLSISLVSALIAGSALPALAQIEFAVSSDITYRQIKKDFKFYGGSFDQNFLDGNAVFIRGCSSFRYRPPGYVNTICSPGTTGLVTSGSVAGTQENLPYLLVTSVFPALAVAPMNADKIRLNAAPASELPRPAGGFRDGSYSLFFNLTTTDIREYSLTHYYKQTNYRKNQQSKFDSEVVPGAYYYSFPSLRDPNIPAPISAVVYPMIEGRRKKNNVESGFAYSQINNNKYDKKGFYKLSYLRPNKFEWIGVTPSNVFAGVDTGYFSIKVIKNAKKANSPVVKTYRGDPVSIFPPYQNGRDPRVQLRTPYANSFTTPPIFDSGTRGVVQVQYQRQFKTGGVSYDYSSRQFQVPVVVLDTYNEYEQIVFDKPSKRTDLLLDTDNDGYNNLNEWILDSDANDSGSIPVEPVPELVVPNEDDIFYFFFPLRATYFGFDVQKKLGTQPKVKYTLQVSRNNGKTWKKFKSSAKWSVQNVRRAATGPLPPSVTIEVRSLERDDNFEPVQPVGTANHIYRVKVTLKKKK